jgi:hypothetical protein
MRSQVEEKINELHFPALLSFPHQRYIAIYELFTAFALTFYISHQQTQREAKAKALHLIL